MIQPVLRTARLVLRPFSHADIDDLHAILSDPEVMRYWGDAHTERHHTAQFVAATIDAPPGAACDFVIERDGRAIGKAGMWQAPEIGFFLHPDHQGQGLAAEALSAIITHLFAALDLAALTADVDPGNVRSLAVLTRLGFRETAQAAEIASEWRGSTYLTLRREDWPAG